MRLSELVRVEENSRNQQWEQQFLKELSDSNVHLINNDPHQGPDGWPYLLAQTQDESKTTSIESFQKIVHWLSTRGMGLVINPQKEYPDYIFTYGMIWSFRETGYFFQTEKAPARDGQFEFSSHSIAHAGTPTEQYLPGYVRKILREFFRDQGLLRPRILVMSQDLKNYDLAISLESLGNPPQHEHQGIAEAIGWFLPPHYSLVMVSEKNLPEFGDL